MKTFAMIAGLAAVFAAGVACGGLFSKSPDPAAVEASCDGLTGQAKADCEKRTQP
ncbi:MAG: hypothetical protein ACRERC_14415 [Candidatus Binatia bacterium]